MADTESTKLNKVANGTAVKTFNQWKQWLTKKSPKHQDNESGNGIQLENRNGDGGNATALVHTQDPGPRRAILRTTVNNEQQELQVKIRRYFTSANPYCPKFVHFDQMFSKIYVRSNQKKN